VRVLDVRILAALVAAAQQKVERLTGSRVGTIERLRIVYNTGYAYSFEEHL
jgi:hypothetical protein